MSKTYVGDGVYVEFNDADGMKLTVEDGERTQETIFMEPDMLQTVVTLARAAGWRVV